jgi:hypothetical protein
VIGVPAVALPLRAQELPKCVVCGCLAGMRCAACSAPLCDRQCAVEHGLDAHNVLPRRHPARRRRGV